MGLFTRKPSHGYWEEYTHLFRPADYECSECGRMSPAPYDICPNCGAVMDDDTGCLDELLEEMDEDEGLF